MLYGHKVIIHTGHQNLTHPASVHFLDRVLLQCLLLKECGAAKHYIPGEKNIVVDALSRLPTEQVFTFDQENDSPLNLSVIAAEQVSDQHLQTNLLEKHPKYTREPFGRTQLFMRTAQTTKSTYLNLYARQSFNDMIPCYRTQKSNACRPLS